jgi:hypothetical protein
MNAKIYWSLCWIVILLIVGLIVIILLAAFATPPPRCIGYLFPALSFSVLILGPIVCHLAHNFPPKGKNEAQNIREPLTLERIISEANLDTQISISGCIGINPPIEIRCINDFLPHVVRREFASIDAIDESNFPNTIHLPKQNVWAPPGHFQILRKPN